MTQKQVQGYLCTRHCSKRFIYNDSFNPYNDSIRTAYSCLHFTDEETWGIERLTSLPTVTQLLS